MANDESQDTTDQTDDVTDVEESGQDKRNVGSNGYPEDTPVAEMTASEQAAYWKAQSRKHERRNAKLSDYDDLKAKAEEYDRLQEEQASDFEKATKKARKEGYEEALKEANLAAARQLMAVNLKARGMSDDDVQDHIEDLNMSRFLNKGEIDVDRIARRADSIGGKLAEKPGPRDEEYPPMGQGRSGNPPKRSAREAARADLIASGRISTE